MPIETDEMIVSESGGVYTYILLYDELISKQGLITQMLEIG